MADKGYIRSLLTAIPDQGTRRVLIQAFEHVLDNLRLGVPEHQTRAVNSQQYWLESRTSTTADSEFTIVHGLAGVPRYVLPVLDVSAPGARIVRLEVSRAADANRIYLQSPEVDSAITLLVE